MNYFATQYTIHFDDTMAYGSHHFLTSFKFQCDSRESFLFGEQIFDAPGVRESLDGIHLFTADAYSRNLHAARLGDRLAILLSLEEWQRASARFCYRVIDLKGRAICAGFQTLICADATTGRPLALPAPLWNAMEQLRSIEEPRADRSFRERVLAGGSQVETLFGPQQRQIALDFLAERYPRPQVVGAKSTIVADPAPAAINSSDARPVETWVFAGQGSFDAVILTARVKAYANSQSEAREILTRCGEIAIQYFGAHARALVGESVEACVAAIEESPGLSQVAIHLQNVLGAQLRRSQGHSPSFSTGLSFGEIAAFGVAGCFDLPTGVQIVCERVRAIEQFAPTESGLLAVSADRESVAAEAILAHLTDVVIAGRNHQRQTIVSGPNDQLELFGAILRELNIPYVTIASPTSFHHPSLREASGAWLKQLKTLPLTSPTAPLYTPNGRRFVSQSDDIAVLLASQMLKPFDFQGGIADLVVAGTAEFLDCGSSGSLARLIEKAAPAGVHVTCLHTRKNGVDGTRKPTHGTMHGAAVAQPLPINAPPLVARSSPAKASGETGVPPIAIVGAGCVLPSGVASPAELYRAIMEQQTGIVDQRIRDPQWEEDFYSEKLVADRSTSFLGGSIDDRTIVCPAGMDPKVFRNFSRTQQLLAMALAPCAEAIRGAERVLCFVGATADGFEDQDIAASLRFAGIDPDSQGIPEHILAARSKFQEPHGAVQEVFDQVVRLGLEVILLDAACASSLYSVALGMQALEANQADAVIAGGIFCPGPGNSCLFSQFRGTTSTGLRPFDAHSNGVVFSEGASFITLQRAADAKQQGLPITAVLRGAGLSSDGRSTSANVPQTRGQLLALERCYSNYRIDRGLIDAVEAHGTSTPVGDATEVETLHQFFSGRAHGPLPIHSLKGLIGHAGWAAGTASIVAACEYMRNGVFPAQAHYSAPSKALTASQGTLCVLQEPQAFAEKSPRIAINGFGFGGANAHVVVEHASGLNEISNEPPGKQVTQSNSSDQEIVFVAVHEVAPTLAGKYGPRFDRDHLALPKGHVILPDLADDMDVTQKLAVLLVAGILAQLPKLNPDLQQNTGLLLAQSGKSERGVEATMRILAQRLRRGFGNHAEFTTAIDSAHRSARKSGPYTLQGMMPNVASGRAMLQFDLNGPNFVVDAGSRSLEAALETANLLLRSGSSAGAKLMIIAAINANPWRVPFGEPSQPEEDFAAAFAVTTRRIAKEFGLQVLATAQQVMGESAATAESAAVTTSQKVKGLLHRLVSPEETTVISNENTRVAISPTETFPIYAPLWVDTPAPAGLEDKQGDPIGSLIVLVPDEFDQVAALSETLPNYAERYMIVVVGSRGQQISERLNSPYVCSVDLAEQTALDTILPTIDRFQAELIVTFESVTSWGLSHSLQHVANDNSLCEFLFLVAQRNVEQLRTGQLSLWGLFDNAWRGEVHPVSGPIAGLLKSINREVEAAVTGTLCTADRTYAQAFECLLAELRSESSDQEIVYEGNQRKVRRLRSASVDKSQPQFELDNQSVVVATGGMRGVTAVMVEALLRDYQCTVIALGRRAPERGPENHNDPDVQTAFYTQFRRENPNASILEMRRQYEQAQARWEAYETMQQLSTLGGRIEYRAVDITDEVQLEKVVNEIVSQYGRIDLLVHGAGVQFSKRLEHRTLQEFQLTYSVKLKGLRNLIAHTQRKLGKVIPAHILSSAYSIFGNDGQHDYGAANETLDRLCGLTNLSENPCWSSIAWLAWDGIGMTRGSEYQALSKQRGLSGINAEEGQQILRQVIRGKTGSRINVPLSDSEHSRYVVTTVPPSASTGTGRVFEQAVKLASIDCLEHHKVRETPTLPGAWILDSMVAVALQLAHPSAAAGWVSIRNVTFHRFIRYTEQEPNLRAIAEQLDDGQIAVWLVGDLLHESGRVLTKDLVFAEATVSFTAEPAIRQPVYIGGGDSRELTAAPHVADPYCQGQRAEVALSGPFDCVRDIAISTEGRHARYVPNGDRLEFGKFPALLLDAALRVGAMYAGESGRELFVPIRIGRVLAPLGARGKAVAAASCEVHTTAPIVTNGRAHWKRTEVHDDHGSLCLIVEEANAKAMQ